MPFQIYLPLFPTCSVLLRWSLWTASSGHWCLLASRWVQSMERHERIGERELPSIHSTHCQDCTVLGEATVSVYRLLLWPGRVLVTVSSFLLPAAASLGLFPHSILVSLNIACTTVKSESHHAPLCNYSLRCATCFPCSRLGLRGNSQWAWPLNYLLKNQWGFAGAYRNIPLEKCHSFIQL